MQRIRENKEKNKIIKKTVKIDNNDNFDLYKNVINKLDTEIKINNKNAIKNVKN